MQFEIIPYILYGVLRTWSYSNTLCFPTYWCLPQFLAYFCFENSAVCKNQKLVVNKLYRLWYEIIERPLNFIWLRIINIVWLPIFWYWRYKINWRLMGLFTFFVLPVLAVFIIIPICWRLIICWYHSILNFRQLNLQYHFSKLQINHSYTLIISIRNCIIIFFTYLSIII